MKSFRFFDGSVGEATITGAKRVTIATGKRSRIQS